MKILNNGYIADRNAHRCSVGSFSFRKIWLAAWLAIAAMLIGRALWLPGPEPHKLASAAPSISAQWNDAQWNTASLGLTAPEISATDSNVYRAIEKLRVGQRVVADNPDLDTPEQTTVDPATWRLVRLYAEEKWPDGTLDTIHIETLQSPEWIEFWNAQVGAQVPPPLDLVEMGLPVDLQTEVVAIEPCPTLQPGPGRLVLTTVNHLNNDVWQLTAVNSHGHPEQLRPTGLHKFYSETRGDWVSTNEIHDNEIIRGRAGPLTITASHPLPGTSRVYNLTVEGEHVYYVSELGLLAHNMGCDDATQGIVNRGGRFGDLDDAKLSREVGHHIPQNAFNRSLSRRNGPAVGLTIEDHALTRTFSGKGKRTMRVDGERGLNARQRLTKDIRDLRSLFGRKYNRGSLEAIEYSKTLKAFEKNSGS